MSEGNLTGGALWPGDKLRKNVEAAARRMRRRVVWIEETTAIDGVLIETQRSYEFERIPITPKSKRPLCGARCQDGHECRAHCVEARKRCRLHGGLSTGPKTEAGRLRIAESNRRRAK
jgi:hypothetical protein